MLAGDRLADGWRDGLQLTHSQAQRAHCTQHPRSVSGFAQYSYMCKSRRESSGYRGEGVATARVRDPGCQGSFRCYLLEEGNMRCRATERHPPHPHEAKEQVPVGDLVWNRCCWSALHIQCSRVLCCLNTVPAQGTRASKPGSLGDESRDSQ